LHASAQATEDERMTSIRQVLRHLFGGERTETPREERILSHQEWTAVAREWNVPRRRRTREAVRRVVDDADMQGGGPRRYTIPEMDGTFHSLASLHALLQALDSLEGHTESEGE
jgi:cation diffusion facilitator CzcD-associated flavoprotein CzcO